ncbi:2-amino-4-hydroxy-6-hydroxymethyldihydropteridine diphosphokinase [Actinomyces sp. B33]|uniref:2-amino-4-hydroxy-6- hydroxymethyldihydropteridine diphosphokinase n=1 Tax=Actinomyces sp. B33 TaxID=2942131 RepID=UPI0023404809|nr:2-amino-4-hydroxy-6-hydroxymethyldihydropteridine diphosphokinase [Actinomyces sp. B33]MDC4233520.1 2-amino-4-hydroxy-6-hydroxymethyldihydropteridine diphosphokinase [Actinomyces sp. B33]
MTGVTGRFDRITLSGLRAHGVHGVLPQEHRGTQPFTVDVVVLLDASRAAVSDDLGDTVSYAELADEVVEIISGPSVRLIETLAYRIADRMLAHGGALGVEVTVHKPEAPMGRAFSDVAVTVRRGQWDESDDEPVRAPVAAAGRACSSASDSADSAGADDRGDRSRPGRGSSPQTPSEPSAAPGPSRAFPRIGAASESERPAPVLSEPSAGAGARAAEQPAVERAAVLALGANLGDAPTTLKSAVSALIDTPGIDVDEVSPILRTRPVLRPGQAAQDDYWNAVVLIRTRLEPRELLAVAHRIEADHGRVRLERWGARTLDIDLVQVSGVVCDSPELTLPHPRARSRAFVLAPWAMADPDAVLEGRGRVVDLLELTSDREGIVDAVDDWLDAPDTIVAESDALLAGRCSAPVGPPAVDGAGPIDSPAAGPRMGRRSTSRLDLVPDASRSALTPASAGNDLVWRRLWERWASTPVEDQGTGPGPARAGEDRGRSDEAADGIDPRGGRIDAGSTASRSALAPAGVGDDLVWRRLWEDRASTPVEDRGAGAGPSPLVEPASSRPAGASASVRFDAATNAVVVPPARPAADDEPPVEAPASVEYPLRPSSDVEHAEQDRSRAREAQNGAGDAPEGSAPRRPRWRPVFGAPADEGETGAPAPRTATYPEAFIATGSDDPEDPVQAPGRPSRLPQWNFSREPLRIVDDGPDDDPAPRRQSVLDPALRQSIETAPVHDDETTRTGLLRKVVVRPTTTGQMPIVKESGS